MTEIIEMMFTEINKALGFNNWYDSIKIWGKIMQIILETGIDEEEVEEFFNDKYFLFCLIK